MPKPSNSLEGETVDDTLQNVLGLLHDAMPVSLDALAGFHSFRIDYVAQEWCVKAHGQYIAACDTEREAMRFLAMYLMKLALVRQHTQEDA